MKSARTVTPAQARERLADACARAEYCTHELREKLRRWRVEPGEAERIVQELVRTRYVDDARYAGAFVRRKAEYARWGRRKIAAALAMKRIDRSVAAEALGEIDPQAYEEALTGVLQAKARMLGDEALTTYDGRTRLFRHAASRGYETDAIARALRRMMAE